MKRRLYDFGLFFVLFSFALLVGAMRAKAARFQFGGLVEQFTSTATSGGTTTLTVTSKQNQIFTGSSNQTVTLPDATTSRAGWYFWIINQGTGTITVNDQGSNLVTSITGGNSAKLILTSVATANGTWQTVSLNTSGIGFDINGLTEDSLIATGDFMTYYDTVAAVNRKIDFDALKTAIATDNINRLTARGIATGDFISFYDAPSGESSKVDYDTLQTQIAATALNPPGGSNTQVQYNNSGAFGGDASFTWDNGNKKLSVGDGGTNKNVLLISGGDTPTAAASSKVFIQNTDGEIALEAANGSGALGGGSASGFTWTTGTNPVLNFFDDGALSILHKNTSGTQVSGILMYSNGIMELLPSNGSTVAIGNGASINAYLTMYEQSAPGTPSTNSGRIYMDSTSGELTIKKDDGSAVSLETQGGASTAVWDAIVGSAAQVSGGRATHSTFDAAAIAVATYDTIFVLPGTHTCTGTLAYAVHIKGAGHGSVLDCALTIAATQAFTYIDGIKFTDNVTIATGSGGNVLNPVWFANGKGTVNAGDASGNANFIIQFEED